MRAWQASSRGKLFHHEALRRALTTSRARFRQPSIADLLQDQSNVSKELVVNGWVKSIRKQKRVAFAAIGDGSTIHPLQAVFLKPEQAAE